MPPAIIGGVIAGVATIGGAALSSHSTSSAARQATEAQTQNTAANNALTREIYNRNTGNFIPYMQSGAQANSLIDSFIYGPQQGAPQPQQQGNGGFNALMPGGYGGAAGTYPAAPTGSSYAYDVPIGAAADSWSPDNGGYADGSGTGVFGGGPQPDGSMSLSGGVTTQVPQNAMSGYDAFVASPYYQNPLAEGFRGLNHNLASIGRLESGDAYKRAIRYGQDYGAGRQDEYLNLVGTQANRGFGAASALAGVGQNMVNNITANNNNAADAVSNAALLRAQANNSLYSGIAGGLGTIAGGIFNRSSYGKGY